MNYSQALNYFHETQKFGNRMDLHSIGVLLEHLGNPQKSLKYVHVAGTNGKGSTVAFISNILIEAGYRVGVYTSPFIQRFTERIKINDQEIPEEEIANLADKIKIAVDNMQANNEGNITEFDLVTAMAFLYFAQHKCDIVVLEVGLGGRLDSTNIIDLPEVAVITTVSYDHMDILGNTLPQIAYEKAGIIKNGCEVVLYPQETGVETLFQNTCSEKNAQLHQVDFSKIISLSYGQFGQKFSYDKHNNLVISLLGDHQLGNAATAICAVEVLSSRGYTITEDNINKGLRNTRWGGRLEIVQNNPLLLIDGAHNVQGVDSLKDCLIKYFPDSQFTFIIGVLADKEYKVMMEIIEPIAQRFITITPSSPRALSSQELATYLARYQKEIISFEGVEEALLFCKDTCRQEELICAFGSLYYIGSIRSFYGL